MGSRVLLFAQLRILVSLLLIAVSSTFVLKNQAVPGSGRILCFFVTDNVDSFRYHLNLAELLEGAGYNVTVLGVLPLPRPFKDSTFLYQRLGRIEERQPSTYTYTRLYTIADHWYNYPELDKNFNRFLSDHQDDEYDLVILAYYHNIKHLERAACFRKPIILSTETWPALPTNWEVGNPRQPTYLKMLYAGLNHKSNRILNFLGFLYLEKTFEFLLEATHFVTNLKAVKMNTNFKCPGVPLDEVRRNISLVFTNHHFTQGSISPHVPALISIGGIQIPEKPSPLPQRIAHFLNNSKKGVIYINLGSSRNCTHLSSRAYRIIYSLMLEMEMDVLWRSSGCLQAQEGTKILFENWVPQNDVLAHPNVELFITHGRLTSITEGQYHGVPMLAIPFRGNEIGNVEEMVSQGFGLSINPYSATFEEFHQQLTSLLYTPKYKNNIKKFSHMYRDRPLSPQRTVLYWVDYVLRYNGAKHMRSPSANSDELQMLCLDTILLFIVMPFSLILITRYAVSQWSTRAGKEMSKLGEETKLRLEKLEPILEPTVTIEESEYEPELASASLMQNLESVSASESKSETESETVRNSTPELVTLRIAEETLTIEKVAKPSQKRRRRRKRSTKENKQNGASKENQKKVVNKQNGAGKENQKKVVNKQNGASKENQKKVVNKQNGASKEIQTKVVDEANSKTKSRQRMEQRRTDKNKKI